MEVLHPKEDQGNPRGPRVPSRTRVGSGLRVIIAGDREMTNQALVDEIIEDSRFVIAEVVSGGARGVDTCGENWAKRNKIPIKQFPARWREYGRGAGPIRNGQMAAYADALIAIPVPYSVGTRNMIKQAQDHKLEIYVQELDANGNKR